jgi:NitT/TauT family transport system substrate-binding protein
MPNRLKALAVAAALAVQAGAAAAAETMRLEWVMQGQFAGPIVAYDKGWYKEAGIELELLPAGPDIKPAVTVAQGTDTFGIGHPHQVIAARANGAPLVMVLQFGQKSATTYIARKEAGIARVQDMPGHSVGLWFGGDEYEFQAMLAAAGVPQDEVKLVSQGFDIIGWLNKDYDVMQVTLFNELLQVYDQGIGKDDLTFLNPEDYGVQMTSGGIFATEATIVEKPELVQAMVDATMRGWQAALADPGAAAETAVKYNSELSVPSQVAQIKAMGELICFGPTLEGRFGYSELKSWETSQKVLLGAKLIDAPIELDQGFTNAFWEKAPAEYRKVSCPAS